MSYSAKFYPNNAMNITERRSSQHHSATSQSPRRSYRVRDLGVGYGRSDGYAADRSYTALSYRAGYTYL
jgi:hypothetical protein